MIKSCFVLPMKYWTHTFRAHALQLLPEHFLLHLLDGQVQGFGRPLKECTSLSHGLFLALPLELHLLMPRDDCFKGSSVCNGRIDLYAGRDEPSTLELLLSRSLCAPFLVVGHKHHSLSLFAVGRQLSVHKVKVQPWGIKLHTSTENILGMEYHLIEDMS